MKKLVNNFILIMIAIFTNAKIAFAENDSDFFAAAEGITLPTDETATGATAPQVSEEIAEQAQNSGNFIDSAKGFFSDFGGNIQGFWQNFSGKLQEFANFIGDKLNGITGGNPLISKIAVALVLVLISIVVIVVLVLIAKKFVKKTQSNPFQAQPFDSLGEDEENIDFEDTDDDNITDQDIQNDDSNNTENHSVEQTTLNTPTDISGAMRNFLNVTE